MNYQVTLIKPFGALIESNQKDLSIKDLDLEVVKKYFHQEQLVLLRGFHSFKNDEEFSDYCETWGEVSLWPFGKILNLIEQESPEDHIFDNSYVPLHWDGMYRPQVPEFQIFHCVKAPRPGEGGRTTFSNTIYVLKNASDENKKNWASVVGKYQRKMEFYNSVTVSPIIVKHPYKNYSVIRYNELHSETKGYLVNPPSISFLGVNNNEQNFLHQSLIQALYSPQNFYSHEWKTGDVVIADNFSLLHGREGFQSRSPRHLQRVQVLSQPPYENPGLEFYK